MSEIGLRSAIGLSAALLAAGCGPITEGDQPECFAVVSAATGVSPNVLLMLDKCTGATWVLVKTQLKEAGAGEKALFTYRWAPITKTYIEPQLEFGP